MASMCSAIPWVGAWPFQSTNTSLVWCWANTPFQSALFHPTKSRSSMPLRLAVTWSSAMSVFFLRCEFPAGPVAGDCSLRTDRLRVDVNGDVPAHKQPTGFFEQFVGQSEIVAGDENVRVGEIGRAS